MRIAQIAPPWYSVPPHGYGGIELIVSLLTEGLLARGHDVTLFASGGSLTNARLVSPLPEAPDPARIGDQSTEIYHALASYRSAHEFDLIHDHTAYGPSLGAMLSGRPPIVVTLHGPWNPLSKRYYGLLHDRVHLVAISLAQMRNNPDIRHAGVVHNGIDLDTYRFRDSKDDFLLFIGRANQEKGPELAVEAAKRAGRRLVMVVKRNEPAERAYWERVVVPCLSGSEEIHDRMSHAEKVDLLGRARATLFPIQWAEPFGLVMIESMACGTPVIAVPRGSVPEVVLDGETGFLCGNVDEMASAVGSLDDIDPKSCRRLVEERFSIESMLSGYEEIYRAVLGRQPLT